MQTGSSVVHVIAPAAAGGAETVVLLLAAGRSGPTHVAALMQNRPSNPFADRLREAGVAITEIRSGRRRYLAEARRLERLLAEREASVVHTHGYHADLVGYRAARQAGVPVVTTAHGFTGGGVRNRMYELLDRRIARWFDAVIGVSQPLCDVLGRSGVPRERIHLIPNGRPPVGVQQDKPAARARLGLPREGVAVGWIGRFTKEKGPDLFVQMSARESLSKATPVMIGDGPERRRLEHSARRVRFVGARANAPALLRAFDVVVISSRTEGTPMVLLEAMGAHVPVVAFAVGGIPGVLDDESGWLVPPGDVSALARAVSDVLSRPDEAQRRADRASQILEQRFGSDRWIAAVEKVYDAVLAH